MSRHTDQFACDGEALEEGRRRLDGGRRAVRLDVDPLESEMLVATRDDKPRASMSPCTVELTRAITPSCSTMCTSVEAYRWCSKKYTLDSIGSANRAACDFTPFKACQLLPSNGTQSMVRLGIVTPWSRRTGS